MLNTGDDASNILASVSSSVLGSDLSNSDLSLDALAADQEANLTGKLVLVQNRRIRFSEDNIIWEFIYDEGSPSNPIEDTFASDSAYVTGQHINFFVDRGLATQEEVDERVAASYAQLFELIPAPVSNEGESVVVFEDNFDDGVGSWNANPDNGTSPTVSIDIEDSRLVLAPVWNATGDAIALKYQQFVPSDITGGADISFEIDFDPAYAEDGNTAMQLILEDENYNPAFFAYRNVTQGGNQTIEVNNVGPSTAFGYVAPGFDFTKVAGIGFQILANNKAPEVGGNVSIDSVSITALPPPPPPPETELAFTDTFDNDIDNWNVSNDGTGASAELSLVDEALAIDPTWSSTGDAFTVKYQQFADLDITGNANISFDVKLPAAYVNDGSMAIQLVIEDANFAPGYIGYAQVSGRPADEFFTLTFENINPSAGFGFIVGGFDFERLAGVGLQFVAGGKPIEVGGQIVIDNVVVSASANAGDAPVNVTTNTSVLFATAEDTAFIKSIDSNDIRSEGMSYGMMVAVMMDDKVTFDKLWSFTKTYMQNKEGNQKDFFAWRLNADAPYEILDNNSAPDGEEYFAMALFFANNRWGSGEGIFDYSAEANSILFDMVFTKTETTRLMMNPVYQQIEFLTGLQVGSFTDPSYHLPAFYELWALWADDNNQYWHEAAAVSRDFFAKAGHPVTGLFSEYASHEGEPQLTDFNPLSHKSAFDSYRVIGNIAMDYHWFSKSPRMLDIIERQVSFFESEVDTFGNFIAVYDLDGTREPGVNYRGEGRNAMNGFGATASEQPFSDEMLGYLWDQNPPAGEFRYYDGLLYMMSMLHASGEFKIHKPQEEPETTLE